MCNVYRRFVPNFAHVAAPLNRLLTKGQGPDLPPPSEEQTQAFELLKKALAEPPVLQLPNPDWEYSIDTDASAHQIGCALFQNSDDGVRHPIGFWSRSLSAAERNYSAGEREALAIIWAVQILHPYLWGRHFKIFTDHQALRWVFLLDDPTGRLSRWRLRLQDFDFEVRYNRGTDNVVADAVSRLPTYGHLDVDPDVELPVFAVEDATRPRRRDEVDLSSWTRSDYEPEDRRETLDPSSPIWQDPWEVFAARDPQVELITIEELLEAQGADEECKAILDTIAKGNARDYVVDERGILIRVAPVDKAEQAYITKPLRARALYLAHHTSVAEHPGVSRQYYTMRRSM